MPTLQWIGKDAVINHHLEVPVKTLEKRYTEGSEKSENKIIHGDNLEALKALLPEYEGRVKCVYIDPPYNTGNENWVYNDNVNSPRIRKWLEDSMKSKGVGPEDLTRHDKWLCMMYPRLKLLHQLLADDGVIFISIDDNEQANLKLICDEIFGGNNFISQFVWKKKQGGGNDAKFVVTEHEYIMVYSKSINSVEIGLDKLYHPSDNLYPNHDNQGDYGLITLDKTSIRFSQSLVYDIEGPDGITYKPRIIKGVQSCWRWGKDTVSLRYNELVFQDGKVYTKYYRPNGVTPRSLLIDAVYGRTESGKDDLTNIFGSAPFNYPKPVSLIEHCLSIASNKDSIILDSFAGSGTTAHAVLNLNKKDGGNRKFILVEMEDYAESITAERVCRVINGYPYEGKVEEEVYCKKLTVKNILNAENILQEAEAVAEERLSQFTKISKPKIQDNCIKVIGTKVYDEMMEGTGGDFSFYELGETVMVDGNLNEKLDVETIREFVWYSETHSPYTKQKYAHPYLLGRHDDTDYYFYYEPDKETTLDRDFLATITQKAERYLIYADNCLLPQDDMAKYNIVFKKIPRDIKTF